MKATKELKKKITSAKNISKVTRAMQMVAASKMKKSQDMAKSSRSYAEGISELSKYVIPHQTLSILNNEGKQNSSSEEIYIVIAPEKGLCGSLVVDLFRLIDQQYQASNQKIKFHSIGNKAAGIIKSLGGSMESEFSLLSAESAYTDIVLPLTNLLVRNIRNEDVISIKVFFTSFVSAMKQKPMYVDIFEAIKSENQLNFRPNEVVEPTASVLAESLFVRRIESLLFQCILESYASEQSARMIAMKAATDSANSIVDNLTIEFNKSRQAAITEELADISSGQFI